MKNKFLLILVSLLFVKCNGLFELPMGTDCPEYYKVNPMHVKFFELVEERWNVTICNKAGSKTMHELGNALDTANVMDYHRFMANYSSSFKDHVYLATKIYYDDVMLIAYVMHEIVHVEQWRDVDGYMINYLIADGWRAIYEGEAFHVSWTLDYLIDGDPEYPDFENYGFGNEIFRAEDGLYLETERASEIINWTIGILPELGVMPVN